jgi:ABC-type nickel/cobalt efflux system permease component RcnA
MNLARFAKAIVAVVAAGLLVVQTTITMSATAHSWVTVSIAVVSAIAVYLVPNAPAPDNDRDMTPASRTDTTTEGKRTT